MSSELENPPTNYDEMFANEAAKAAEKEKLSAGTFLSLRASGITCGDTRYPDGLVCVILESVNTNIYYADDYDPDNPTPPACWAISRDDNLAPGSDVAEKVSDNCKGCPHNEWGSSDKGRGKKCQNTRRVAIIPAGEVDKKGEISVYDDVKDFENSEIVYFKPPVTSVKKYSDYVHKLKEVVARPPWGVITRLTVVPDAKTQFKLHFEMVGKIPDNCVATIRARHIEAEKAIMFSFEGAGEKAESNEPKKKKKFTK